MSAEISTKIKCSKSELVSLFKNMGFCKSKHVLQVLGKKNIDCYFHFNMEDFLSFDGVELVIWKESENLYVVCGRSRCWRSNYDTKKLNSVFKILRKTYNVDIVSDYGKNRYIPLDENEKKEIPTPTLRGLYLLKERINEQMQKLKCSMPKEKDFENNQTNLKIVGKLNMPTQTIYNALLPYLVAIIERFFSDTFIILLQYDKNAQNKIANISNKYRNSVLFDIANSKQSVFDLIAKQYNFQNRVSIKDAYKILHINIEAILIRLVFSKRQKLNAWDFLETLLSQRHELVHTFAHTEFSEKDIANYCNNLSLIFDEVYKHIRAIKIK